MNREVVLRVRAPNGLQRLTIDLASSLSDLKAQVSPTFPSLFSPYKD